MYLVVVFNQCPSPPSESLHLGGRYIAGKNCVDMLFHLLQVVQVLQMSMSRSHHLNIFLPLKTREA